MVEYGMDTTQSIAGMSEGVIGAGSVRRYVGQTSRLEDDLLPIEEPLQIRMAGEDVVVTMRTPGHDDELAAGFLFTEGIIEGRAHIESIAYCLDETADDALSPNVINVNPTDRDLVDPRRWQRNMFASSSCGVCGKVSIEQVQAGRVYPPGRGNTGSGWRRCTRSLTRSSRHKPALRKRGDCTRLLYSPLTASYSCCARTLGGIMPWTKWWDMPSCRICCPWKTMCWS